ncbi:MAG: helix-turn-helix transcriptional regulator [Flavobacteriales bacterium]
MDRFLQMFGKRVSTLRNLKGLTQETLGLAVGTSQSQITRIEHGEGDPPLTVAVALARELGVSILVLIEESEELTFNVVITPKGPKLDEEPPTQEEK